MLRDFLLLSFAVYRAAQIITSEDDLFGLLAKIRGHFSVWYESSSDQYFYEPSNNFWKTQMARVLTCVRCISVWLGIFFAILYFLHRSLSILIAMPFALSATAIMLEEFWKDDKSVDTDLSGP